ncbi:MAG: InlB B-repeat-containing protein [Coriobacteriia bacterium]|nr:InlB B-repeat-containing protein [Coriobacteriia bacterium]
MPVTFKANGGSWSGGAEDPEITQTYGQTYKVPAQIPTLSNNNFVGWFTEDIGGSQITDTTPVSLSIENLYAHWVASTEGSHSYQIHYVREISAGNYEAVNNPIIGTLAEGSQQTFNSPDLTTKGYTLRNPETESSITITMGTADLDPVYVIYDELDATLNYSCDESQGSVSKSTETVKAVTGNPAAVTATPKEGVAFKQWEVEGPASTWTKVSESATFTPARTNNIYVSANYRAVFESAKVDAYFVSSDSSLGTLTITGGAAQQSVAYGSAWKITNNVLSITEPGATEASITVTPVAKDNNEFTG